MITMNARPPCKRAALSRQAPDICRRVRSVPDQALMLRLVILRSRRASFFASPRIGREPRRFSPIVHAVVTHDPNLSMA